MTVGPKYTHQRGASSPHHTRCFRLGLNKWKVGAPNAHKVFGGGSCIPCVYRNAKGTLYTTSDGISFVGKNFLFRKTVHIQWSDILEIVEHDKKIGSSSAASISLVTNGDTKSSSHVFSKVKQPQQTLNTLVSMHNESMHFCTTAISDDTSIISNDSDDEDAELQDKWKQLKHDESYSNQAIQDQEMPCTIDTFFDTFIADSASHSTKLYHEAIGDTDISVTPWKFDKKIDAYVRTIEFKHPVDIAVAPPFARARKEQRYCRFGQYGLSLETDTYIHDVPLATCFYAADRVLVEPNTKKEGHVAVHAKFDVRFIKRMMFQSLATSLTAKEFVEGFQNLKQYWSTSFVAESSSGFLPEEMPSASGPPSRTVSRASTAVASDNETHSVQATSMVTQSVPNTQTVAPILCTKMQFMVLACGLASFLLANVCLSQSC